MLIIKFTIQAVGFHCICALCAMVLFQSESTLKLLFAEWPAYMYGTLSDLDL